MMASGGGIKSRLASFRARGRGMRTRKKAVRSLRKTREMGLGIQAAAPSWLRRLGIIAIHNHHTAFDEPI